MMSNGDHHNCLSFTAPTFSDEEAQKEKDDLSEGERTELHDDISGVSPIPLELPTLVSRALDEFQQALQNADSDKKSAYAKARAEAPGVVDREANPLMFLRAECFHAKNAVERMLEYWQIRVEEFGDRAFCPMSCAENGAMTKEDVAFFRQGSIMILPVDRAGRTVIYGDRSKWTPKVRESSFRSFFYAFQMAVASEDAQKHGCCLVMDVQKIDPTSFDRKISRRFIRFFRSGAPLRVRVLHRCYVAAKSPPALYRSAIFWMLGKKLRLRCFCHFGAPKELLWDLEQHGMSKSALTPQVGGTFTMLDFEKWCLSSAL